MFASAVGQVLLITGCKHLIIVLNYWVYTLWLKSALVFSIQPASADAVQSLHTEVTHRLPARVLFKHQVNDVSVLCRSFSLLQILIYD